MAVDWDFAFTILVSAVGAVFAVKAIAAQLRRTVLIPKHTILDDIPVLGRPKTGYFVKGTAVIAGGSVGGLYAAAVCSHHFEDVLVVEPEILDQSQDPLLRETTASREGYTTLKPKRARVMQYDSSHGYQPIHLMAMKKLFPHLEEEMAALGIRPCGAKLNSHVGGKQVPSPYDTLEEFPDTLIVTRHCFETLLRRLVLRDCPKVRFVSGIVTNLVAATTDSSIIKAVSIRKNGSQDEYKEQAVLVVDATGASQAGYRKWLPHLGLTLPEYLREQYDPGWNVMTCNIEIPEKLKSKLDIPGGFDRQRWHYIGIPVPNTEERRVLLVARLEGNILHFLAGGWAVENHPTTLEELKAYGESLTGSLPKWILATLATLVEHSAELKPIFALHKTGPLSVIKYHEAPEGLVPRNYVAIGDAVMVTNPGYGQGCSKALVGAVCLDNRLRVHAQDLGAKPVLPKTFSQEFFKLQYGRIGNLWKTSKSTDYGFETTIPVQGESRDVLKLQRKIGGRVLRLVLEDPDVARTSFLVRMFLAPSTDLFAPDILFKLAKHTIKGWFS